MSRSVKVVLYFVCITAVCVLGFLTWRSYRAAAQPLEQASQPAPRPAATNTPANPPANPPPPADAPSPDDALEAEAPAVAAAQEFDETNAAAELPDGVDGPEIVRSSPRHYTRMVTFALGLLLAVIALGILVAHDVSHFIAHRAERTLFNADGQPADPEYEKAEQLWADGQHLQAIQAMREYLNNNPREQYVALRIAEIYEENLNNPLAAALEYEEVLKKNLPPERWGWAAIHLANIYSGKLNKSEDAIQLLRRIDAEYGQTAAAAKARERLAQIDPDFVPSTVPQETSVAAEKPASNLPPGFRPKS